MIMVKKIIMLSVYLYFFVFSRENSFKIQQNWVCQFDENIILQVKIVSTSEMWDHMLRHNFLPGYFDSSHDTKTDSLFPVNKYYFWINVMSPYEYDFMANLPS